jgi:glucose/arabinose dehydrogenase
VDVDRLISDNEQAQGRPVGVKMDQSGALLVADDVGNAVWHVTSSGAKPSTQ